MAGPFTARDDTDLFVIPETVFFVAPVKGETYIYSIGGTPLAIKETVQKARQMITSKLKENRKWINQKIQL